MLTHTIIKGNFLSRNLSLPNSRLQKLADAMTVKVSA